LSHSPRLLRPNGSQDHEISVGEFLLEEYPFYNWESSSEPFSDSEDILLLEHDNLEMLYGYEVNIQPVTTALIPPGMTTGRIQL
jgi:hypothetical protein